MVKAWQGKRAEVASWDDHIIGPSKKGVDRLIHDIYTSIRIEDPVRNIQAATGNLGHLLANES